MYTLFNRISFPKPRDKVRTENIRWIWDLQVGKKKGFSIPNVGRGDCNVIVTGTIYDDLFFLRFTGW